MTDKQKHWLTEAQEVLAARNLGKIERTRKDAGARNSVLAQLAGGLMFALDAEPFGASTSITGFVASGLKVVAELAAKFQAVDRNPRLTDVGKFEELKGPRGSAIMAMAAYFKAVLDFEAKVDAREQARYSNLWPSPMSDYQALSIKISDWEIRSVLREMTIEEQMDRLQAACEGNRPEVLLAVLRSQAPGLDSLSDAAERLWKDRTDRHDPKGRVEIDADRETVDWAKRALMVCAVQVQSLAKFTDEQVAVFTANTGGYGVYGLDSGFVARAVRADEARGHIIRATMAAKDASYSQATA